MINIRIAVEHNEMKYMTVQFKDITLEELIGELNLDKLKIGAILVNGVPKKLNNRVVDNSEIYILPVLAGG